jgi:N-methylhydantoinase A
MNRGGIVDIREALEGTFKPLISRQQIAEVTERLDYTGSIIVRLDEGEVRETVRKLVEDRGIDSLVISFLWSQLNRVHEERARDIALELYPDLFITMGSDICGNLGEFKRTSTAVINAYIGDAVKRQGARVQEFLTRHGLKVPLLVMQTLGGVAPLNEIGRVPVMLLNSGPAGGVVGALAMAKEADERNIVCMDMGGTSCDISAITEQEIELSSGMTVLGHPIAVSGVELESIGAGGGSIATLEQAGDVLRLRVGPESAGSSPGPACYGRGGVHPTVTDANLVLGFFDAKRKLGGEIELDLGAARTAIQERASPTGSTDKVVEDAWGIYRVITATMSDAIEDFLVSKGYDPRRYSLAAFGAAGPLHAASIGDRLGSPKVLVPGFFPVFSAYGLMSSDIRHAYSLTDDTVKVTIGKESQSGLTDKAAYISERLRGVAKQPIQLLNNENVPSDRQAVQLFADLRYAGQMLELDSSIPSSVLEKNLTADDLLRLLENWMKKYKRVYGEGAAWTQGQIEVINYRAVGVGRIDTPKMPESTYRKPAKFKKSLSKRSIFLGEWLEAEVWDETSIETGMVIIGPALVEGDLGTVLIGPKDQAEVDLRGNLLITPGGDWGWRLRQ